MRMVRGALPPVRARPLGPAIRRARSPGERARRRTIAVLLGLVVVVAMPLLEGAARPSGGAPPRVPPGGPGPTLSGGASLLGPLAPRPDGTGQSEIRADANDSSAVPFWGIESNFTGYAPGPLPPSSSFQVSTIAIVGPYEVVFGIFENDRLAPVAFYAVYQNASDTLLRLVYWPSLVLVPGEGFLFALVRTTGSEWEVSVNGVPFANDPANATLNLSVPAATWTRAIGFAETAYVGGSGFVPPTVTATLTFATLTAAGWYLPTRATVTNIGQLGTPWGIEGTAQHPTLAPGEIVSGPSIAPVPNGTALWAGGPVPLSVGLSFSRTTVPANGFVDLSVSVTRPGGVPVPDVYLQFRDTLDGGFAPPTVATGAAGNATGLFQAPNLSATALDTLSANITLFGFHGNASLPITVLGVVYVTLEGPASANVAPSGAVGLTFRALDPNGTPLGGLAVVFAVNASAHVTPAAAFTGSDGSVHAEVAAPSTSGTLRLVATVEEAGYWGACAVTLRVAPTPPTWYDPILPYLAPAGLAIVGGILLFFAVRWLLRPNRPLPPLARIRPPPRRPVPPPPVGPAQP
jgi:hypothetical protein